MRSRVRFIVLAAALVFGARTASAELYHGTYVFPGKLMLGARPLGAQVYLTSYAGNFGSYKFGLDFSGKIWENPKLTLWLGGEFNLGGRGNFALIEPGIFAMITFEKLLHIPLVPLAMAGIAFPIGVIYGIGGNGDYVFGGFGVKIGGGAYYFLIKQLGVGGEMHFMFAGAFGGPVNASVSGWAGYWDFLGGVRVAF